MVESRQSRTKRSCFITAPARADLTSLREVLLDAGLLPVTVQDSPASAMADLLSELRRSELVVAIVGDANPNVFFELGLAVGMGKKTLVLADPDQPSIPGELATLLNFRAKLSDRSALEFAVQQAISHGPRKATPKRSDSHTRSIGKAAGGFLKRLESLEGTRDYKALEVLVTDVLRATGITIIEESHDKERGPDFAVWADELQFTFGNPILIELKFGMEVPEAGIASLQLRTNLLESNARWGILLYAEGPSPWELGIYIDAPNVIPIKLREFIISLRNASLAKVLVAERNRRVHSD